MAAELGSTDLLVGRYADSWEAECLQQLVKGTVGFDDIGLDDYKQTS